MHQDQPLCTAQQSIEMRPVTLDGGTHFLPDHIPFPKRQRRLPTILDQQEVALLIDSAGNLMHRTMLMMLYATGLRRAEMCHLKVSDIDSKRMVIHVRQGKGGRDREYMPYPDMYYASGLRDVHGAQLPDFLEHDVMPAVAAKYRVLGGGKNSALWGASLSGAAALYIAIQRPDLFDRMIIESPSLTVGNGRLLRDSVSLTNAPHRIALGIGTAEALDAQFPDAVTLNAGWVRLMHSLAENLKVAAYTQPQVQLTVAEGAHHSTAEFGNRFAAGLLFIYGPEPARPTNGK
jgi:predicted alpha/beta superfamily hydrolase